MQLPDVKKALDSAKPFMQILGFLGAAREAIRERDSEKLYQVLSRKLGEPEDEEGKETARKLCEAIIKAVDAREKGIKDKKVFDEIARDLFEFIGRKFGINVSDLMDTFEGAKLLIKSFFEQVEELEK